MLKTGMGDSSRGMKNFCEEKTQEKHKIEMLCGENLNFKKS
jgi:hypothetical protein